MTALLLALLALFGLQPPQVAPPATGIECSTCKGSGRALQDCLVCDGKKQVECGTCSPMAGLLRELDPDAGARAGKPSPEVAQALEALRQLRETQAKVFGEVVPGRARCPAMCREGKGILNPGKPCKFCGAKGSVPCPRCNRKGLLRCSACEGHGQVVRTCEDCLGTGHRPDPARIASERRETCPLCAGTPTWPCRECDEKGFAEGICRACNGEGSLTCAHCLGTRSKPCTACSATGDNTGFLGPKKSSRCEKCDAKGVVPCDGCARGAMTCPTCKGKRLARQLCLSCFGTHTRLCAGCVRDGTRAWELAAETLLAGGDAASARAFLEIARKRIEAHFEKLAASDADPKAAALALEKERKAALERIDRRIAATQPAAK